MSKRSGLSCRRGDFDLLERTVKDVLELVVVLETRVATFEARWRAFLLRGFKKERSVQGGTLFIFMIALWLHI